ncbi:MAG: hypothetical protein ABR562_02700, partial [Thermoplasmatota archaeon]
MPGWNSNQTWVFRINTKFTIQKSSPEVVWINTTETRTVVGRTGCDTGVCQYRLLVITKGDSQQNATSKYVDADEATLVGTTEGSGAETWIGLPFPLEQKGHGTLGTRNYEIGTGQILNVRGIPYGVVRISDHEAGSAEPSGVRYWAPDVGWFVYQDITLDWSDILRDTLVEQYVSFISHDPADGPTFNGPAESSSQPAIFASPDVTRVDLLNVRGSGDSVSDQFENARFLVQVDFSGNANDCGYQDNFIVHLLDANGRQEGLWVNGIGQLRGSRFFQADPGKHSLEIRVGSCGNWEFEVSEPASSSAARTTASKKPAKTSRSST